MPEMPVGNRSGGPVEFTGSLNNTS